MPLISICIPTHNHGQFLAQAIDSCLSQSGDFEIIVLDDHSGDNTPALKGQYVTDPRIKWYRKETLTSVMVTYNTLVSYAAGDYIKILNADDSLLPGCIARLEAMIAKYPKVGLHAFLADIIDHSGHFVRKQIPGAEHVVFVTGPSALKGKLRQQIRFREPTTMMVKRDIWRAVGGYDETLDNHDTHFNINVMNAYPCAMWPEYLVEVRRYATSLNKQTSIQRLMQDTILLIHFILKLLGRNATLADRFAASGYILYRYIELNAQHLRGKRTSSFYFSFKLMVYILSPFAWFYALPLIYSIIVKKDVQQRIQLTHTVGIQL